MDESLAHSDFRLIALEHVSDERAELEEEVVAVRREWHAYRLVAQSAVTLLAERDRELRLARAQNQALRDEYRRVRERMMLQTQQAAAA